MGRCAGNTAPLTGSGQPQLRRDCQTGISEHHCIGGEGGSKGGKEIRSE